MLTNVCSISGIHPFGINNGIGDVRDDVAEGGFGGALIGALAGGDLIGEILGGSALLVLRTGTSITIGGAFGGGGRRS